MNAQNAPQFSVITPYESKPIGPFSLANMIEHNAEAFDIHDWMRAASVGEQFHGGGGAAAEFTLQRIA